MRVLPALTLLIGLAACGRGDPAGTWVLSKDEAFQEAVRGLDSEGVPEESRDLLRRTLEGIEMSLTLEPGGTFRLEGNLWARFSASGTWKLDGTDLSITSTVENGAARATPEAQSLVWEGDAIRLPKRTNAAPVDLVLRRR
jgi:hypothetical protein